MRSTDRKAKVRSHYPTAPGTDRRGVEEWSGAIGLERCRIGPIAQER